MEYLHLFSASLVSLIRILTTNGFQFACSKGEGFPGAGGVCRLGGGCPVDCLGPLSRCLAALGRASSSQAWLPTLAGDAVAVAASGLIPSPDHPGDRVLCPASAHIPVRSEGRGSTLHCFF